MTKSALIVVDVQRDFCEGGALAVEGGNAVAERIAGYIKRWGDMYKEIVFTADMHNPWPDTNGGHFSMNPDYLDSWPVHCVAGTEGAYLHPAMYATAAQLYVDRPGWDIPSHVFDKGQGHPHYSGFQGKNTNGESLHGFLSKNKIIEVDIMGIAGDYCVKHTALDAKNLNYLVTLFPNHIASVGGRQATMDTISEVYELENVVES